MLYVIVKNGRYVCRPGSKSSYTSRLELAQKFNSRLEALANACGDETVHSIDDLLVG